MKTLRGRDAVLLCGLLALLCGCQWLVDDEVCTLQATGIGRAKEEVQNPAQARMMAEAAAEVVAQQRLVYAITGKASGKLSGFRTISTEHLDDGSCRVTLEVDVVSRRRYEKAVERLEALGAKNVD